MDEARAQELLDQLAKGEVSELLIEKTDFETFRNVLIKRDDFKHFHGIAQRGGHVKYEYMEKARS